MIVDLRQLPPSASVTWDRAADGWSLVVAFAGGSVALLLPNHARHEAPPDTDAHPSSSPKAAPQPPGAAPAPPPPAAPRAVRSAASIRAARHYFERRERQWSGVPAETLWASWLASPEGVAWASGCNAATPATGARNACNAPAATPATPPSSPSHSLSSPGVSEVLEEEDARGPVATATPATVCNAPAATFATATPPTATLRDNPLEVLARASGGRVSPFASATDQVRLGMALADVGLVGPELEAFGRALAGDGASKLWPKSDPAKARGALTVGFFLGRDGAARMLVDGVTRWKERTSAPPAAPSVVKAPAVDPAESAAEFRRLLAERRGQRKEAVSG